MSRSYRVLPALLLIMLTVSSTALAQRKGRSGSVTTDTPPRPIAVLNGFTIPQYIYDDLRQDQVSFQQRGGRGGDIDQLTDDQLFLQMMDAEIIRQEAARRKIAVGREEVMRLLIENPPKFMRDLFLDEKGVFQKEAFVAVVRDPSKIAAYADSKQSVETVIEEWRQDLDKVLRFVQNEENKRRVTEALLKEKPLTPKAIRERYFAENTFISGSFVRVLHSTIPDSLIPISEAEARGWYNTHKEEYRVPPARWLASVIIPVNPLPADSARQRRMIDSVKLMIESTPLVLRADAVTRALRGLLPSRFPEGQMIMARQLPEEAIPMMRNANAGDLVGPIQFQNELSYFYVDAVMPAEDTLVRASHILLRTDAKDPQSDSVNHEMALALKEAIKTPEQFAEGARVYGQDGSNTKGGDLGFFARGRMIHEFDSAAFAGKVGEIVGPVRTRFGYHLIRITDKLTNGYRLRELRFPLVVSTPAADRVRQDANAYAEVLRRSGNADSALASLRARHTSVLIDTSMVKRLEPYGDALATTEFAFNAKVGDVGVVPLPYDRIAIVQLLRTWAGGVPSYEEIPIYPISHARRKKQLDMLEPKVKKLADVLEPEMLLGPIREITPMAEVFLIKNQIVNEPPDETKTILDSLISVTGRNSVSGPVRGKHGYYFLRVIERSGPSDTDFERDRETFTKTYVERYRTELVDELVKNGRNFAELKDNRPLTRMVVAQAEGSSGQ